eukprot:1837304-Heterocapsa_arctica.AAC.1
MLRNYTRYIQHTLVREDALNNKKIKGSPTGKKGRQIIRPEQWDMKSRPAGTMSAVLGVGEITRLSTVSRRKEYFGEENSVSLS